MRIPYTPLRAIGWMNPYPRYYHRYYYPWWAPFLTRASYHRDYRAPSLSSSGALVIFGLALIIVGLIGWGVFLLFCLIGVVFIVAGFALNRPRNSSNMWSGALRDPSGIDYSAWDGSYEQAKAVRSNGYTPSSVTFNCPCCGVKMAPSPLGARCPQCGYVDSS
jgi:hypothetical protein